ncbi:MAG: hypothetical protein F6K62_00815 [Sphaerospermopsis sp. SIO1G2]|nr:hypothetical protein [Sphaerospermopsis sp. SIO1G2]
MARALAVKPQVLLIDEICAGLDYISAAKIEEVIECLSSELTIVFISHNIQQVSRLSDFTALFHYNQNQVGQLLECSATKQFITHSFYPGHFDYVVNRFR